MKFSNWMLSIAIILFSKDGFALSCHSTQDRIFAACEMGVCEPLLYIIEVRSYSQCSRRPSIEPLPSWAKEVFEFEILSRELANEAGIYELLLDGKLGLSSYVFANAEEYRLFSKSAKLKGQLLGQLNQINGKTKEELELEWRLYESNAFRKLTIFWVLHWLSLAMAALCLIYSILWFHKWQRSVIPLKWVFVAIGIQVAIITVAFASISARVVPLFIMLGIFIPGIWLYQIATVVNFWWSNKTTQNHQL